MIEMKDYTTIELEQLESKIHNEIGERVDTLPNVEKECDCKEPIAWYANVEFDDHVDCVSVTVLCIRCGGDITR